MQTAIREHAEGRLIVVVEPSVFEKQEMRTSSLQDLDWLTITAGDVFTMFGLMCNIQINKMGLSGWPHR